MLRRFALLLTLACCTAGLSAAAEKLTLDQEHSHIHFVGSKADGKHTGGFKKFTADAAVDVENPSEGSLEIVIDSASLFSDDEKLTNHLKNPDFFDVRKYPKITFKATKISHATDDAKASIVGKLKMLDKEIEITVPVVAEVSDSKITLTTDFKIDRTRWGMVYGKGKVNDDVLINAVLVLKR